MTDRDRSNRQAFFISCIGLTFFDADHRIWKEKELIAKRYWR
jgi:hypothetical protein